MKNKLLYMLFFFYAATTVAQKPCGNPKIDTAAMARAEASRVEARAVSAMVRVYFHILKDNDGSNAAITTTQIQQEFRQLLQDFAPNNICFAFMGVDSINNTFLNNSLDSDNPAHVDQLAAFNVPGCINIYYSFRLPKYGGNAFAIPNDFCIIAAGNINLWRSISHEVGHCLGLSHTFSRATGEENINGSNCASAGDRVCDTPADPYSHLGEDCFSNSGCLYTGSCTDPTGATMFSPPYNNIMGYWGGAPCSINQFTSGQYSRANSFLFSTPRLVATLSATDITYGPVTHNSGTHMPAASNNFTTNGAVLLGGTIRAGLQGRTIRLNPGFRASPSSGQVYIRGTECYY